MISTYLFGQTFYTQFGEKKEIVGSKTYHDLGECYLVNSNYPEPAREDFAGCDIVTEADMHDILSKQDRKSTRLNSSHIQKSRMPSSA